MTTSASMDVEETGERGLTRRWVAVGSETNRVVGGDPLVRRVFTARGLGEAAEAARFLEASMGGLHDPSLMPDLDRAAGRLLDAARGGEAIVIYGDYDVDGVSATAILWHTLRAIVPEVRVSTYVPHRIDEGYGLNEGAIRELIAGGAKVIVTVDCGVTAVGPAVVAKALGADLIITDHHNTPGEGETWPEAFAIVHPRRPGSAYPFGDLCGAGVAFKLAWRMATLACGDRKVSEHLRGVLLRMMPLAALAAIADVVPLVGENRVLVKAGLRGVRQTEIPGLRALITASGLDGEKIGEEDVGFRLGPRLNACGRLGHARDAVELFTTAEGKRAAEIADALTRVNRERQVTEAKIVDEAREMAERAGMTGADRRAIVLSSPNWHAGVVGIVCSRLVEAFGRPAILLCERDGVCAGSGRSIDGFSLHSALAECAGHLRKWGGHDMAAGLAVEKDNLAAFVEAFALVANREISEAELVPKLRYDTVAAPEELTLDAVRELGRLAPFGRGNPRVLVRVSGLRVAFPPDAMSGGKHLGLKVERPGGRGHLRLVWWNKGDLAARLPRGTNLEAVITPNVNEYNGRVSVEGQIADVRIDP